MKQGTKAQRPTNLDDMNATNGNNPSNLDTCRNNRHQHTPSTSDKYSFRIV